MKRFVKFAAALALYGTTVLAIGENATHVPGYTIHHNALTTDILAPKVAKAYNIQRSKSRGMLNVSVIKDATENEGRPVRAKVTATATNLNGQIREIPLREVRDGDAIYYIGDFRVANEETLNFDLQVTPEGSSGTYSAKLSQQFFSR
jgi:hypothetical protein